MFLIRMLRTFEPDRTRVGRFPPPVAMIRRVVHHLKMVQRNTVVINDTYPLTGPKPLTLANTTAQGKEQSKKNESFHFMASHLTEHNTSDGALFVSGSGLSAPCLTM